MLQITLELVSWKAVSHIGDDKKVIKKILKEGEGYEKPNEGAVVKVKLIGKLQDGTVFYKKGHDGDEEPFEFQTDEGVRVYQIFDFESTKASKHYEKAAKCIEYDSSFGEEEKKQAKALKVTCNLNNAACKLKLKKYKQAEKMCTKVIEMEGKNVKALYRRAQAYINLAGLDLADFDIKKALELDPANRDVKLEYKVLKGEDERVQQKKTCQVLRKYVCQIEQTGAS